MDKPISLPVKDYLIRVLAVKTLTSEKTIEAIVNHQFQSANEALQTNKSVEISGFARMLFNQKKANKKMKLLLQKKDYYAQAVIDHPTSDSWKNKLNNTLAGIQSLISKMSNEDFPDL